MFVLPVKILSLLIILLSFEIAYGEQDTINYEKILDCKNSNFSDCSLVLSPIYKYEDLSSNFGEFTYQFPPDGSYNEEWNICNDKTDINLAKYDYDKKEWINLQSQIIINGTEKFITTQLDELGTFAIIKTNECALESSCNGISLIPQNGNVKIGEDINFNLCGIIPGCNPTEDGVCSNKCTQGVDPDCGECTANSGDCCLLSDDNLCDSDCGEFDSDCAQKNSPNDTRISSAVDSDRFWMHSVRRPTYTVDLGYRPKLVMLTLNLYSCMNAELAGQFPDKPWTELYYGYIYKGYMTSQQCNYPQTSTERAEVDYCVTGTRVNLYNSTICDRSTLDWLTAYSYNLLKSEGFKINGVCIESKDTCVVGYTDDGEGGANPQSVTSSIYGWATLTDNGFKVEIPDEGLGGFPVIIEYSAFGDLGIIPNNESTPPNYTSEGADCNNNSESYQEVQEVCNFKDDNCNGQVDEGDICLKSIIICKGDGENEDITNGVCNQGEYCSTSTNTDEADCTYKTEENDIGLNRFFTFFCDKYLADGDFGCSKFVNGEFSVCNNNEQNLCEDGKDNDCDGKLDEEDTDCGEVDTEGYCGDGICNSNENEISCSQDCLDQTSCNPGDMRACGSVIGECNQGITTCQDDGSWGSCQGSTGPSTEMCGDNLDNDCDNTIDEDCECTNQGATRSCGGPNQGICKEGVQTCLLTNDLLEWGACQNAVAPQNEVCDSSDNDCDGSVDEGCNCNLGESKNCGTGIGACSLGTQECINNILSVCLGTVLPIQEICEDNIDNDCDGSIDEDCSCEEDETRICDLTQGICDGLTQTCIDGEWDYCDYDSLEEYERQETSCLDKLDNDCDGQIDNKDSDCSGSGESCSDGTSDNSCSNNKPKYCNDGKLEQKCAICGCPVNNICRPDGTCIEPVAQIQKTELQTQQISSKDSDNDGLSNDEELRLGYNPSNPDTDTDGLNDREDLTPLCNENGICDNSGEYPETINNCQVDCSTKESSNLFLLFIIILIFLLVISAIGYYYLKNKKIKSKKDDKKVTNISSFDFESKMKQSQQRSIIEPMPEFKKNTFDEHSNIKDLENYFKEGIRRGYNLDYLKTKSLNVGWYEKEIEKVSSPHKKSEDTKPNRKSNNLFGGKIFNRKNYNNK